MKRRLFWKILIGFWITFLITSQGIWLLFTILRPAPEQSDYIRGMARMAVAAAESTMRLDGEKELRAQIKTWPRDQRRQLEIRPLAAPQDARTALDQTNVAAPDGRRYRISYYYEPSNHGHGIFGIPREVLIVTGVGGLFFSAILAWYLTQPVDRMRGGFASLAQGNFSIRLGPAMGRRRDEIADLAHDFDRMAVRLQELVAARDRLLADVSHELRTPLARLNLAIGLARQDPARLETILDRIGDEARKLDELVGELLTLAKLESGQNRSDDYFDFAEVIRSVVDDARYEASGKNADVQLAVTPDDEALEWLGRGNGRLVSRAVENIVRNAIRYSPEGGTVRVALEQAPQGYRLTVTDSGPGVPDESLPLLFRPFGISADGSGFGLGLAIAQRAIAVHQGRISARNCTPHGFEITVTLPAEELGRTV